MKMFGNDGWQGKAAGGASKRLPSSPSEVSETWRSILAIG
jgi:hypothetical protein